MSQSNAEIMAADPDTWVEVDGELVPNYDMTLTAFAEGDVVTGLVVRVDRDEILVDIGYKSRRRHPDLRAVDPPQRRSGRRGVARRGGRRARHARRRTPTGASSCRRSARASRRPGSASRRPPRAASQSTATSSRSSRAASSSTSACAASCPPRWSTSGACRTWTSSCGQTLRCRVIELNRSRNNVVLSRRAVLEEERREVRQRILDTLDVGQGRRRRDLEHRRLRRLRRPRRHRRPDPHLRAVAGVTSTTRPRSSRSARRCASRCSTSTATASASRSASSRRRPIRGSACSEAYEQDDVVHGRVTKVVTFGAFVEILPGVEGLVHISELAAHHVENPREVVAQGQDVLGQDHRDRRRAPPPLALHQARRARGRGAPAHRTGGEAPLTTPTAAPHRRRRSPTTEAARARAARDDVFGDEAPGRTRTRRRRSRRAGCADARAAPRTSTPEARAELNDVARGPEAAVADEVGGRGASVEVEPEPEPEAAEPRPSRSRPPSPRLVEVEAAEPEAVEVEAAEPEAVEVEAAEPRSSRRVEDAEPAAAEADARRAKPSARGDEQRRAAAARRPDRGHRRRQEHRPRGLRAARRPDAVARTRSCTSCTARPRCATRSWRGLAPACSARTARSTAAAVGARVFADPSCRVRWLERSAAPARGRGARALASARGRRRRRACWCTRCRCCSRPGCEGRYDATVLITAPDEPCARARDRASASPSARSSQLSEDEKARRANHVYVNDGDRPEELEGWVADLVGSLTAWSRGAGSLAALVRAAVACAARAVSRCERTMPDWYARHPLPAGLRVDRARPRGDNYDLDPACSPRSSTWSRASGRTSRSRRGRRRAHAAAARDGPGHRGPHGRRRASSRTTCTTPRSTCATAPGTSATCARSTRGRPNADRARARGVQRRPGHRRRAGSPARRPASPCASATARHGPTWNESRMRAASTGGRTPTSSGTSRWPTPALQPMIRSDLPPTGGPACT